MLCGSKSTGSMAVMQKPLVARRALARSLCRPARKTQQVLCFTTQLETVQLGRSGVQVPLVGVGSWSWGDKTGYWGYGKEYGKDSNKGAFEAAMQAGLVFIDTAEVYGLGKCEEYLGDFIQDSRTSPVVASKFAPYPWRWTADAVTSAAKASLARMRLKQMSLYYQHWPGFWGNEAFLEGLIRVKEEGLAQAIGVSNFNAKRVKNAVQVLGKRGIPLACNQVQYSLLYRAPETNGVMEACKENDVTLIAYSPLAQGMLTGKYKVGGPKPAGPRAKKFGDERLQEVQTLLQLVDTIAKERGKTMSQVATNWCICKGAVPIPGAKNASHVAGIAGSIGWRLSDAEMAELDAVSSKVPVRNGVPLENY